MCMINMTIQGLLNLEKIYLGEQSGPVSAESLC